MFEHEIEYPAEFSQLPLRELLRLSQTNVTVNDHMLGLQYAAAAYDKGQDPEFGATDKAASGEAAAKAGFRAEQADFNPEIVEDWFVRSLDALRGRDPSFNRERIATLLLGGRALALREVRTGEFVVPVRSWFMEGELNLNRQHSRGRAWDRYATMLYKFWATYEAMSELGGRREASMLALRGIYRAIGAKNDNFTNENNNEGRAKALAKHGGFVIKQTGGNIMAAGLALTRPLESNKVVQKARRRVALSILG